MLRRLQELMNRRPHHPLWIAVPVVAAIAIAGLLWGLATYEAAGLKPGTPPSAPATAAARLPEPDSGERTAAAAVRSPTGDGAFTPPKREDMPEGPFGDVIRLGRDVFVNTQEYAKPYVGNGLNCVNCHLDEGRKANSAPLWAAYGLYPAYREKNKKVNSFEDRLAGCFTFSMNGTPPPYDSKEMVALVTYSYWLAQGAPVGAELAGRGYPNLDKPAQAPDAGRGAAVFTANCALCHGAQGEGTKAGGKYAFPPLWGKESYNGGAGMNRVQTAAAFIRANMPLGKPGSLSVQEAWDVAEFVNTHERPGDPRKP